MLTRDPVVLVALTPTNRKSAREPEVGVRGPEVAVVLEPVVLAVPSRGSVAERTPLNS